MYRNIIVVVFVSLPLILSLQVAGATDLINLENVAGKVLFYQKDGNATYQRGGRELASDIPTEAMFELFDPMNTLRTASFTYNWDFGNGEVFEGSQPFVRYNYSISGNYTLRLRVGANIAKSATNLTGTYSMNVTVLDAIKSIQLNGPLSYQVSENSSMSLHVHGSPPLWVCWRILPNCVSETPTGCQLTMLYKNSLNLDHTFTSPGVHCLDISARNNISKLQTSYNIFVRRDPSNNLLFILPCAAILMATFLFIGVIACRPRRDNTKSQETESSDTAYIELELPESSAERGESQPLLQHGSSTSSC